MSYESKRKGWYEPGWFRKYKRAAQPPLSLSTGALPTTTICLFLDYLAFSSTTETIALKIIIEKAAHPHCSTQ